jgi:hypothetical protein
LASLGVSLDERSLDRGESGSRLRFVTPRTHQVGWRLLHACRCVIGRQHKPTKSWIWEESCPSRQEKNQSKKGSNWDQASKGEKRKDLSKVKCFPCHKPGHYASQFPIKKKGNKSHMAASTSAEVDDSPARFENEFSLITCLSNLSNNRV